MTRRDVVVSSSSAGLASLVAICPLTALLLLQIASPAAREYGADIDGRAADRGAAGAGERAAQDRLRARPTLPLRRRGPLAAASHLMIACPFPPRGLGRLLRSHPPTGERVRRLEGLAGVAGTGPR